MRIVVSLLTAALFVAAARRLRPQSPAPSTSSGSRHYIIRSWQVIARPRVSGSAVSSSATLTASNVIVLSADPFGSQSPPLGHPREGICFRLRLRTDCGGDLARQPPLAPNKPTDCIYRFFVLQKSGLSAVGNLVSLPLWYCRLFSAQIHSGHPVSGGCRYLWSPTRVW
jgi:hypothetical protein